jgi:hypothetical protein
MSVFSSATPLVVGQHYYGTELIIYDSLGRPHTNVEVPFLVVREASREEWITEHDDGRVGGGVLDVDHSYFYDLSVD